MSKPQPTNANIIVKFDYNKKDGAVKQANGLFIPERYLIEGDDEDAPAAYGVTTNRKLINPQLVDIYSGHFAGKRAFVYYGAFEIAKWLEDDFALIPENTIFFLVNPIECMPGTYLGDEVFTEGAKTESGIWLTPIAETKDGVKIIITHIPENAHPLVKVGTKVVTVDSHQYDLEFEGKKYIKLKESEIIGIETESGIIPIGDRIMVEYLPDEDISSRIAENDRRAAQRDFIGKSFLHIDENYARGLNKDYLDLEEPKTVRAKVIAVGDQSKLNVGDVIIVHRYYGCKLLSGQWILNMDYVYGTITEPGIKGVKPLAYGKA